MRISKIKGGGDFILVRGTPKYIHNTKVDTLGQSNGETSARMSASLRFWLTSRKEVSLAQTPNTVTQNVVLPKPLELSSNSSRDGALGQQVKQCPWSARKEVMPEPVTNSLQ